MMKFLTNVKFSLLQLSNLLLAFLFLIIALLPEDWQRIILDEQEKLKKNQCSDSQLLMETLHLVLSFLWIGIRLLPLLLTKMIKSIDPNFVSKGIHKAYNLETIKKIEEESEKDYYNRSIVSIRLSLIMSFFLYLSFVFLDKYCSSQASHILSIRLVICSFIVFVFCKSFQENFNRYYQLLVGSLGLMGGIGIILMIFMSSQNDLAYVTYYSGLILVYMAIYSVYRIRFFRAVIVGTCILLIYNALTIYKMMIFDQINWLLLINSDFFLVSANIIGAVISNLYERSARLDFLMRYIVSDKLLEIYRYYEHTSPSSQDLLNRINKIRHCPRELEKFLMENLIETKQYKLFDDKI